ncbi:MAG TPA: polyphosphate kinase 1 [Rhodothermales bacterium]|nr:polyphosphate kinase 1 [Rhodothermales bacterium]
MSSLLQPHHLALLHDLADEAEDPALQRRAHLLLLYHEGHSTREVAQAVELSESQVRHWRRQFKQHGMALFPSVDQAEPTTNGQAKPENKSKVPAADTATTYQGPFHLSDPDLFVNRELSLLEFQRRVLEEAEDESNPLLERLKFLAIVGSNLDEFFMVRVGGLKKQVAAGVTDLSPDGMTPAEQIAAVRQVAQQLMEEAQATLRDDLLPALRSHGIFLFDYDDLNKKKKTTVDTYFEEVIFPVLTPLAFDPGHPFPHISNLSLNLAVLIRDEQGREHFARVKVPPSLPRLLPIKRSSGSVRRDGTVPYNHYFVWIEQVIAANLQALFPGMEIVEAHPFHITRNADMVIQEIEADDLLETMEQSVRQRRFGSVVRATFNSAMPEAVRAILYENLMMDPNDGYALDGPLGLSSLMSVATSIERTELRDAPFIPVTPMPLKTDLRDSDLFASLRQRPFLLHHPYDSFTPVIEFLEHAAEDPNVLAIKQTLYRVGRNSPVVKALLKARENGKQVAVLVEIKARFDEESNIGWAKMLEQEGVHVIYGLLGLKTHSKIALVIRKEGDHIRRYVHLSTGNYNAVTAHLYEDLGFFTTDPAIGADATDLFNFLTGYSDKTDYRKLLVAPITLRPRLEALIKREIKHHRKGQPSHIIIKTNALVDTAMIQLLYKASQTGVTIDLIVRGICCLRPGIPGLSETISVRSIVGRFLEHSRIYYFHNGGDEQIYLGSADMMPRNIDRRVEILFPLEEPTLIRHLRDDILATYLDDNTKARRMQPDGSYVRATPGSDERPVNVQEWLLTQRQKRTSEERHPWEMF